MQGYFRFKSYINSQTTNNNNNKSCARHVQGCIIMKKSIVLGLAVVMALVASVTAFASVYDSLSECNHSEGAHVEATSQGNGACTYETCKCTGFNQRPGYYQCGYGHQRFSH